MHCIVARDMERHVALCHWSASARTIRNHTGTVQYILTLSYLLTVKWNEIRVGA